MKVFKQKIEFDFVDVSKVNIELVITKEESKMIYLFKMPNDSFEEKIFIIYGQELTSYIEAWKECFDEMIFYKERMANVRDGSFRKEGKNGLIININKSVGYVALVNHYWDHFKVINQEQLNEVIKKYEYARDKIKNVQKVMKKSE